jgi:hypothetical protein
MPKAKDKADAEPAARRRQLETLRDDCRRHKRGAVALSQRKCEGRFPEIEKPILSARTTEDEHDAIGCLDRLGEVLADATDLLGPLGIEASSGAWRRSRGIAQEALLRARSWRRVIETGVTFLDSEDRPTGPLEIMLVTFERRIPDVLAAIAELCDELLEFKTKRKRKRSNPGALWHDAVKALGLMRQAGKDPSDAEIAKGIGCSAATFSRHVGSKSLWIEERAGRTGARMRQASRDPESWSNEEP